MSLSLEEQIIRVAIAATIGSVIGLERLIHSKKAGNKTHQKNVYDLTTSVTVFGTACLGIPIGPGYYSIVVITLIAIETVLFTDRWFGKRLGISTNAEEE